MKQGYLHSALHHWLYWWGYAFTIARSPNAAPVFYCFLCYFLYIIPILLHKIAAETWNAFNYTYNYLGDPLSSDSSVKKYMQHILLNKYALCTECTAQIVPSKLSGRLSVATLAARLFGQFSCLHQVYSSLHRGQAHSLRPNKKQCTLHGKYPIYRWLSH